MESCSPPHDLTIVIPAYNEERRLNDSLPVLKSFLDAWGTDYRVIVADDGSSDRTARIGESFGSRFTTLSLPANRGKGAAVRAGILASSGRLVCFLDADLPFDLECLPRAYSLIDSERADVVLASRDVPGAGFLVRPTAFRRLASSIFRTFVKWLISREISDAQAGFKMFRREAARRIFARTSIDGFAFDSEVVLLITRWNIPRVELPVTLINSGPTRVSVARHTLPMLLDLVRIRLRSWKCGYDEGPTLLPLRSVPVSTSADERKAA